MPKVVHGRKHSKNHSWYDRTRNYVTQAAYNVAMDAAGQAGSHVYNRAVNRTRDFLINAAGSPIPKFSVPGEHRKYFSGKSSHKYGSTPKSNKGVFAKFPEKELKMKMPTVQVEGKLSGYLPRAVKLKKKYKTKNKVPSLIKSCTQKVISNQSLTEVNCSYINFGSINRNVARNDISRSIIRQLFWKHGNSIGDFNSQPPDNVGFTYQYEVGYRTQTVGSTTVVQSTVLTASSLVSFHVTQLNTLLSGIGTLADYAENRTIVYIALVYITLDGERKAERIYGSAKIHCNQFHQCRIQNLSGEATLTDSVTAIPLLGKIYTGKGLKPLLSFSEDPSVGFMPSPPADSIVSQFDAGVDQEFKQSLPASSILNCTAEANFSLEIAAIKTHSLKQEINFKLNDLLKWFSGYLETANTNPSSRIGHFRCIALEKAIGNTEFIEYKIEVDTYGEAKISGGTLPAIVTPIVIV